MQFSDPLIEMHYFDSNTQIRNHYKSNEPVPHSTPKKDQLKMPIKNTPHKRRLSFYSGHEEEKEMSPDVKQVVRNYFEYKSKTNKRPPEQVEVNQSAINRFMITSKKP